MKTSEKLQFFKESHLLAGIEGKEETLILPKKSLPTMLWDDFNLSERLLIGFCEPKHPARRALLSVLCPHPYEI
jgi:hypothetical protein